MPFDFPASPTVGQGYTPAGGPTYVWDGNAWAQANNLPEPIVGVFKISAESIVNAVAQVDILLPSGFRSYELELFDLYTGGNVAFNCRFSYDNGATFATAASYRHGRQVVGSIASPTFAATGGATTATAVELYTMGGSPTLVNAGYFKITIPAVRSDVVQGLIFDGYYWNALDYYAVHGHGRYLANAGPINAIRLFPTTGTFAMASGWLLTGRK